VDKKNRKPHPVRQTTSLPVSTAAWSFRISTAEAKQKFGAFRIGTEAPKLLSAAFRIGTEAPKHLSAAFRIGTEAPKLLSAAFRIGTEAPKLLSAAFRIGTEEPKQKFWPLRPGRRSQNFYRRLCAFYGLGEPIVWDSPPLAERPILPQRVGIPGDYARGKQQSGLPSPCFYPRKTL
jgi:hypothetical protein